MVAGCDAVGGFAAASLLRSRPPALISPEALSAVAEAGVI